MRQFYDMMLLIIFIVLICVFMVCCQNRSRQVNERNAKLFEMRATTPGESELEYEDIESDEMNNDNNDAIADNLVHKGIKSKSKKKSKRSRVILRFKCVAMMMMMMRVKAATMKCQW